MSNLTVLLGSFAVFLVLNVPIAFSIALCIVTYILYTGNLSISYLATNMFTTCDSFPLMAIPFFVLAGALMEGGGLSRRLINFASSFVGHIRGGLAFVTVLTCLFFGAISGSSPATVAAIGTIMVPEMLKQGYDKNFSYALVAVAGCLGIIIPPSIPMVMYGSATNASISAMFIGGVIPGILCGVGLIGVSYVYAVKKGFKGLDQKFSLRRVWEEFKNAIWALLVPVIILGGIYGGLFTPTEAAAVSVLYGFIVGKFIYKELNGKRFFKSLSSTTVTVSTILIVCSTATSLGKIMTLEQIPKMIAAALNEFTSNIYLMMIIINLILLIAGCLLDTLSAILILAPILYPVVSGFGINIVHFGVMMVINLAIGYCTPPVGVNLFVACGIGDIEFGKLAKACIPFLIAMLVMLMLVTYIPDVVLFLPRLAGIVK